MITICEKEGRGDGGIVQRGGKGLVTVGGEEASGGEKRQSMILSETFFGAGSISSSCLHVSLGR